MKTLYIVRGVPGSGKSTFAKTLGGTHFETDMFFMKDGEYKFDATKLKDAHEWCRSSVGGLMINEEPRLVVSNTFTQEWEMKPYYDLAEQYGYRVYSLIVENRHGNKSVHSVPDETMEKMKNRFEVKL
jgi:predicted kinase